MATYSSLPISPKRLTTMFCLGVCVLFSIAPAAAERFIKEVLEVQVADINNNGKLCGAVQRPTGAHAFRRDLATNITQDLGVLPGDTGSRCIAISSLGQVVGMSYKLNDTQPSKERAFLYTDGAGMTDLTAAYCGNDPTCSFVPKHINSKGQIIGNEQRPDTNGLNTIDRAVRFDTKDGSKEYFGIAASESSYVFAINDTGHTLITVNGKDYRFSDGKGLENLGDNIRLSDINAKGQVVGTITEGVHSDAALYTDRKGWQKLRLLKGHTFSYSLLLSDNGIVFGGGGYINSGRVSSIDGVFWSKPECPENFIIPVRPTNFFPGPDFHAINNNGQILLTDFNITNAERSPALVTPIDTPVCDVFEPKAWRTVQPILGCTTESCKNTYAQYQKILRKKAINAIRSQRAADKAARFFKNVSVDRRAEAKADATKKKAIADKAREQFEKFVTLIKRLSDN